MFDSEVIHVRRAIIVSPQSVLERPSVLMVKRAPQPKSKLDPLKFECPGGQVEKEENPLQTLQREVLEECGLRVLGIQRGPYDYSRPLVILGHHPKLLYVVYHFHVEMAPFCLEDVILSPEHTGAEFVDLLKVINVRGNPPDLRYRRSAVLSLTAFGEDLNLIPRFKDQHPELYPKPSLPPSS